MARMLAFLPTGQGSLGLPPGAGQFRELEVASNDVQVDRKLRGSSGECLVCGVLAQFNWAAALTREGVARTDVLAVNADTGRTVTIQVKTTWREKKPKTDRPVGWRLGEKDILPAAAQAAGPWRRLEQTQLLRADGLKLWRRPDCSEHIR